MANHRSLTNPPLYFHNLRMLKTATHYYHYFGSFLSIVLTVTGCIYLCEKVSFWFYPLAILLIGSRFFALALMGHEATHGNIFKGKFFNAFFGRWFFHFPCMISHSYYSHLHLTHHRFLGLPLDFDKEIYQKTWNSKAQFFKWIFFKLATGQAFIDFTYYYNGIFSLLNGRYLLKGKSDWLGFLMFWITLLAVTAYFGALSKLFLYWILPIYLWMPWIYITNQLEHLHPDKTKIGFSRDLIFKSRWTQELLFPLNLNYHHTHHAHAKTPFYNLATQSELEKLNRVPINTVWPVLFNGNKL